MANENTGESFCSLTKTSARRAFPAGSFFFFFFFFLKETLNNVSFQEIIGCLYFCGEGAMAKGLSPTCPFWSHLPLISSVLCLHMSCGRGRWRGENYAQWDTWRIQFEIEMSMNHSAWYLCRNGPQTHSVLLFLRKR